MKIFLTALASIALSSVAFADGFETCLAPGDDCAIRVIDATNGEGVWLVADEGSRLRDILDGHFWLVSGDEYQEVRDMLDESSRDLVFTETSLRDVMAAKAPAPAPKPAPGGPLIGGSISTGPITIGGGNSCAPCHGSDLKEIHKKALEDKKKQ